MMMIKFGNSRFYKPTIVITAILLLLTPLICGKFNATNIVNELKQNGVLTQGRILEFESPYKLGDALKYRFTMNGKEYIKSGNSYGRASDYRYVSKHVIGKTFPVLASPDDPQKYSKLLIVPEDFKKYGYLFPDSLKWIMKHIERW